MNTDTTLDESLLTPSGTTSPFLPNTNIQFAWDSTSIGLLKTCPRLYQYTMIDGWGHTNESIHLRFGSEYHSALEFYFHRRAEGLDHETALHQTVANLLARTADFNPDPTTKAGKYKNRQTLLGLVVDYLDHFVDDPCTTYIKSDGTPAVELSFRFELDWGPTASILTSNGERLEYHWGDGPSQPYLLCGHLDRVVSFNHSLFIMDHKTTTTTPGDHYFDSFEPHNQMTLYTIAGQIVLNAPIKGVIINAAQILLDKPHRFVRGFTYRTRDQLDEWLLDLRLWFNLAEAYAEADHWPMNDTSCDKFGGCKFRGICSKSPNVREAFLKADFVKLDPDQRWNPLASRGPK
jgi:PD-(D/E)XK nuclease superfamily